jgi:hypothetical protein
LFGVGVLLGIGMFYAGGVGVVPASNDQEPTAQLAPWLQKTMCDYPAVTCTSHGSVVTSPSVDQSGSTTRPGG